MNNTIKVKPLIEISSTEKMSSHRCIVAFRSLVEYYFGKYGQFVAICNSFLESIDSMIVNACRTQFSASDKFC